MLLRDRSPASLDLCFDPLEPRLYSFVFSPLRGVFVPLSRIPKAIRHRCGCVSAVAASGSFLGGCFAVLGSGVLGFVARCSTNPFLLWGSGDGTSSSSIGFCNHKNITEKRK